MKRKLTYIELDTHAEISLSFYELSQHFEKIDVTFFLSEKILRQLNIYDNHSNLLVSEPRIVKSQLSASHQDMVVLGTVHRYFNVFNSIAKDYSTVALVHNRNFFEAGRWKLFTRVVSKDAVYRIKLLLVEGLLCLPSVRKNLQALYVLDKTLHQPSSGYHLLPLQYKMFDDESGTNDEFTIVVPGEVSQKRRDYIGLFEQISAFAKELQTNGNFLWDGKIYFRLQLVLLGRKDPKQQIQGFELLEKQIPIITFEEKVPQETFNYWMKRSHILWSPIQHRTTFFSITEWYGSTKVSGNIGDAIKYGKRAVFTLLNINSTDRLTSELLFEQSKSYDKQEYEKSKVASELENVLLRFARSL